MDKSGWKALAIVFVILFILSWALFGFFIKIGLDEIANEESCRNSICNGYDAFVYQDNMCYCYTNNEIAKIVRVET